MRYFKTIHNNNVIIASHKGGDDHLKVYYMATNGLSTYNLKYTKVNRNYWVEIDADLADKTIEGVRYNVDGDTIKEVIKLNKKSLKVN
jgi:uncharacterized protein with LGFP repeats